MLQVVCALCYDALAGWSLRCAVWRPCWSLSATPSCSTATTSSRARWLTGWMMLAALGVAGRIAQQPSAHPAMAARVGGASPADWLQPLRYNATAIVPGGCSVWFGPGPPPPFRRNVARRTTCPGWRCRLSFSLGSPYILRDFASFWRDFSFIVGVYTTTAANVPDHFVVDHWTWALLPHRLHAACSAWGFFPMLFAALSLVACLSGSGRARTLLHDTPRLFVCLLAGMALLYALVAMRTIRPEAQRQPGNADDAILIGASGHRRGLAGRAAASAPAHKHAGRPAAADHSAADTVVVGRENVQLARYATNHAGLRARAY